MPSGTNYNAFCADYSTMANCLFAIQAAQAGGALNAHPDLVQRLYAFDWGILRRLYNRTALILGDLEGFTTGGGSGPVFYDFSAFEFNSDFNLGVNTDPTPGYATLQVTFTPGDYSEYDFSAFDFSVDLLDITNDSYSSHFQTILNMFGELCYRSAELDASAVQGINSALIPVLNEFRLIKQLLIAAGFNLCLPETLHFTNSPYLYLQAAGADGSDGVAAGVHLRWSLAGDMGLNHFPQGDLYDTAIPATGYNRTNDFVTVTRTPYSNPVVVALDFEAARPAIDFSTKQWAYTINTSAGERQLNNIVLLTFTDTEQYLGLAAATDPQTDPFAFLKAYNSLIELEIQGKTAFSFGFDFRVSGEQSGGILKVEALSSALTDGALSEIANIRETITAGTTPASFNGDNIIRLRLQKNAAGFIQSVSFETYADFAGTRSSADWSAVGNGFGLSLTDDEVLGWLETADYLIDNLWPQYNDGTRVRIANYQDKWNNNTIPNDPSLKATVERYLQLSQTDPRAIDTVRDDGAPEDAPGISMSYLDVLNLMALDYHIARMLGLGCIDTGVNSLEPAQFVYKISYTNLDGPGSDNVVNHEYMSLPTGKADNRLPGKPVMRPLTYTLPVGDNETLSAFDANGYLNAANIRLVNIGREAEAFEAPAETFFGESSASKDFNLYNHSRAVLYGIEYRAQGESTFRKPEITSEKAQGHVYYAYDATVPGGVPETTPVPDNPDSLYIHFERSEGIHQYAIYGINWFSRASVLSETAATDATHFPVRNTLKPPQDVAVQYLQEEDTLIFTSGQEQTWLAGREAQFPDKDTNFTRITFNWMDVTDISYIQDFDINQFHISDVLKPTSVNTWFRTGLPMQVVGAITAVLPADGDSVTLMTGSYTLFDGTVVVPLIAEDDLPGFNGSLLTTPEGQFVVQNVTVGIAGPIFTVAKIVKVINVEDDADPGVYATRNTYILPEAGSRFTVTENLAEEANWLTVKATIELPDLTGPLEQAIEEEPDSEHNIYRHLYGGIYGDAEVKKLTDAQDNIIPGYYLISFNGQILPPHPQAGLPFDADHPDLNEPGHVYPPFVDWYNGLIRVPLADSTTDKKVLQVVQIAQRSPLQVKAFDPAYQAQPVLLSNLVAGVNFHPGYKAYLYAEPQPDAFNGANILPAAGVNDKKTLLGLQSANAAFEGAAYASAVSLPAILMARRIDKPVRPEMPLFAGLRVRPDAINKAAFTMDVKIAPDDQGVARHPFGMAFYRTSNEDILHSLYNPDTVTTILAAVDALTDDEDFNQRYGELANLVFSAAGPGHFIEHAGYGFPVPDKTGLVDDAVDTPDVKAAKYYDAIMLTLLPLTAQVPMIDFVKTGKQTDKKQPVIRSADGNLLTPADPAFDPFPMMCKYPDPGHANITYVRLTDYSLNGASRMFYFYGAAEVTNQLATGELSPFAGPVSIVHTDPPEAPVVRFFTLGPPAIESTSPIAVAFSLAPYLPGDTITKVRIYRSFTADNTFSLQSMDSYIDQDIVLDDINGIVITDDFNDMPAFPAGETIYYRLAFLRSVINEKDEPEDILGYGSKVITIRVIDTVNPEAPQLIYDAPNHKLTWQPTVNKGTYYLYQQNSKGNWQMLYKVPPDPSVTTMEYVFPEALDLTDDDGNNIYYRFKVRVENSSGLMNLTDNELTIGN